MAPRSPGARSSWRACRWCRPGGGRACFANFRRCWGPSGSPSWPTRPEYAYALPLDSRHALGDSGFLGYAKAVGGTVTGWISGAVGASLSSDDFRSRVEPAATLHPLWQVEWTVGRCRAEQVEHFMLQELGLC